MLGATDPSHIVRTIEYWDIENRRYPTREHRAVIVAEEITNRFFNVIWLLNRSIPIIAIQLEALTIDGKLLLHFTKVLDVFEFAEPGDDEPEEIVDRQYWERRSSPVAMALFGRFEKLVADQSINVKLNFRQDGIALAGKWNFAKIIPRKSGHCLLEFLARMPQDALKQAREKLEAADIRVQQMSGERFSVRLDDKVLERGVDILTEVIRHGVGLYDE